MLLRSVSRLFVCLVLPLQAVALHASPWSDCWNVAMTESFSPSNYNNFSNLPHIANNGFSRAEYGSSGAFSDACALAPGINNVQYFGLKVTLEAGYYYRLKWTGKTSGFAKPVQVHFGASPLSTQVIGNSHLIPLLNPSLPAPAFTSQSFTPPANGQYYVLLKLAPGGIGSGSIRFDDLVLERSCSLIDPPNVFFTTHEAEASEGGSVEICVGIQTPYIYHATQVQVAAVGPVQPHLASFSTQTLTFPAGSSQNQCFTFQIPANNEPDGDFTYLLKLQNPSSTGGQPQLIQPDTLMLRIKDDVLLNGCYTWSPGVTHTLDNELPGSWQHDAQGSLSSDWADYSGDYAYKTDYSEWNYIAIPFQLSPMFSYRLKWKGRAQNSDGAAIPEILLMRGAAPNSGVQMPVTQEAAGSWGLYTGEAFEVAASGTYYLTIKGGSTYYNLKTKLHIDDIVLERVCKTTSVAFSSVTPLLVQGDEGALFRVCLDIANPSPHRATSVVLNFTNGTSPHFAGAPSPIVVTFPAGSSERQCVDIPSTLWPGDDPRSQYSLQIQSVTGGVYPAIGPDVQRTLQVRDANTCWNTIQQQNFSTALQNLGNISGWISNNGATRSGYGATGQMFDYCASMTMSPSHYAGFQQWLETGKQYRVKWNLKVDSKKAKSFFMTLGTQTGDGNKVGVPVSIAPSGNAQPGVEFISEYFSVPSNGSYYLLLRLDDGESAVVKFDDFKLESRCPVTEVAFQQSLVETAEGNALLVCVQITNPSQNSPTTVEVSFESSRSPHFHGVPATRTVTFPAGSSTPQCLLFPSAANGQYDGGFTEYTVRLQNVTGNGARIAQPDRAFLRITDDVSLNDCQWAGPDRQICTGQSTQLGLPGTAMPAHCSAAPFCFRWEPAALILNDGQYDARPFVAPQQDTWFVIYMTDGFGNLYSDSVLVQVAPALQASITGHEPPVCSGGARTLQVLTSSGAGALSYQWQHSMNGGASWSVIAGVTGSVYVTPSLTAPRMYRVAVGSSACGSVTTTPVTVQVLPDPSLSITASSPTVCIGGWTTLNAVPNNGAGTCTTQWQSSSSASGPWTNIAGATGNSHAASTLVPGIRYYRATYSCSGGGCDMAFSNVVSITVMPDPSISTQPIGTTICSGGTHTLNVTATGGTPALSYQWQSSPNGANWSTHFGDTQSSLTTPPLTSNTYYRVAVSASGSGCGTVYSQTALVQVVALPAWSIAPAQAVLCPDTSLMLSVPDAQGVSYLWSDGSTAPQWEVQQPGAYSVVLTHPIHGCSKTLSTNVSAAPSWTQSIEASSDFLCDEVQEIKLTLNGTSGGSYSYAWSGGSLTEQQILTASGVYYLTLTDDATGCSTVLSRVIQNSDTDITLRIEAPDTLLCRDGEMTLRAVLDGLHESLRERVSYYWRHDGSTNETVSIYGPRLYEITTDFGGGCVQEVIIEITRAPDLTVRIQSPEGAAYACPESPLLLRAVVSDSTLVATYHWTGGADTPEAVFTESGPYTLLVTDVNGCVWEDRFEVKPCPTIVFFDTLRVQVKAEETAELCLRLINPSQETATTVEVAIEGSPAPYFGEAEALRSVEFAPGETRQCLSYLPPRVEEVDSITLYTLRLQNAAGGNQAAIGEDRLAELLIEAGIRCRVQQDSAAVNCAVTDTTSIQNGVPLISTLKKDDSFWAGDFEVKVTQANGNGTFNGKGIITVPYLKQAQINVILKDVRVNEECQMVAGEVKVEGVGAAILSEELANALNDLLGTLDGIDNVLGAVEDVFNTISTVVNASSEVNSVLSTNWNVLHGADPIYNEYPDLPDSLRQQINEALLCYLSQPPSVCNAQLSQTIAGLIAAINALFEADYAIRFRDFSEQHYGFDSLMYQPAMVDDYNFLTVANQPYRVAWKSVEAGRTDSVLLLTPFAQLPDSLHFETNSRTPVPHHEHACGAGCADNGAAILPVTGGEHNKTYQIYPVQTRRDSLGNPERKYAGKLNVVSYNNKVTQVVIVPINGAGNLAAADAGAIQSQLNEIYRPAVASFTVELLPSLSLDWFATEAQNTLDSTNSAFYADYNAQMQRINQEINRLPGYDPEKYYLIVVPSAQGGIKGFMPRARNKGFIVAAGHGSLSDLGRTMAHELGHGAFRLRHPWEQFSGLVPGQTDNLMDYASGTRLHHYQWHIVHNPPPLGGLLDGDEEGELAGEGDQEENDGFQALPNAALLEQCYYTPSGALISFPGSDKITDRKFSAGGPIHIAPAGSLIKFKYKDKIYVAIYRLETTGNYYFKGYYDAEEFHRLPEPKRTEQYPNGKLPAEAYIINPQEGCNVLVRRLDPQCRERFYTWHATSNKPYTGTCTDIIIPPQAVEVPVEDPLFALVHNGPGRAFYNYVEYQHQPPQPPLSDSDCEYIRLIAVEIDRMGDILYESYNDIALSAMSKIDQYYYLNYNSWDYSLGDVLSNLRDYRGEMESLKNNLNNVTEQDRAVLMVMNFRDKELESLPLDIRLHAIRVLSDGNITGGIREYLGLQIGSPETALIRLVRTVPKNQDTARQFLEALKSSGLIALLDRGFDDIEALYRDANYEQFAEAIIDLIKIAFPYDANVANCIMDDQNKAFLWGANQMAIPGGGQMNCTVNYQAQWNHDHTLQFRFKSVEVNYVSTLVGPNEPYGSWQCTETQQEEVLIDPYAWVWVYSSQEVKVDGVVVMPKGSCKAVPAFLFNYLVNERDNGVKRKLIHTGIEVAFLALGVGELAAACRVVRTIAMIDIGLQSTGIVVNLAEDDIVAEFGESGQRFVNNTRTLCMGGGLLTLGASVANSSRFMYLLNNAAPEVAEFTFDNASRLSQTIEPEQYERLHETANNYRRLHAVADQLTLGLKQKFLSQGAGEELANRLAEQVSNLAGRKNLGIGDFSDAFASLLVQLGKERSNTLLARCATWNTETLLAYIQDLPHIASFFRNAPDAMALRARLRAWEGLYTNPIMRTQTDALIESEYLLGKGFSTSDLNVFALHVDVIFSGKKNHLSTRVNNSSGFSLIHTDIQLKVILLRAKSLNLPDDELDDLLFISCRTSKQIFYHELMQQMDNWVNIIKTRGFPFLFHELSQFQSFGISLKNKLNEIGISSIDVRVQGSSLRTPNAGDLDISIMISEYHFDELIKNGYNGRIRMNGNIINMSNMSHQDLINLSNDINLNPSIYNTIARNDFNYNFSNKTINASPFKEVPSGFRDVLIQTQLEFPNLGAEKIKNIQIQQYGAGFDLKPFLNI